MVHVECYLVTNPKYITIKKFSILTFQMEETRQLITVVIVIYMHAHVTCHMNDACVIFYFIFMFTTGQSGLCT